MSCFSLSAEDQTLDGEGIDARRDGEEGGNNAFKDEGRGYERREGAG